MRMLILTGICSLSFCCSAFSQDQKPDKNNYLKISLGSVSFGSEVYRFGYGIGIDAAKNVVKTPRPALAKLLIGAELLFEQAASSPTMGNITDADFPQTGFSQISANTLWPKVAYHPFRKTLIGFNIQAGPTVGYTLSSFEKSGSYISLPTGGYYRSATIAYDHGFRVGYRISSGYEFAIHQTWMAGFRVDFSNTNKGEINTMLGLKGGMRF